MVVAGGLWWVMKVVSCGDGGKWVLVTGDGCGGKTGCGERC